MDSSRQPQCPRSSMNIPEQSILFVYVLDTTRCRDPYSTRTSSLTILHPSFFSSPQTPHNIVMCTIIESLSHLESEVQAVNSFINDMNRPGKCLRSAFKELQTYVFTSFWWSTVLKLMMDRTSAEVESFLDEWRRTAVPRNENSKACIQEQSCRLHQAITLFHVRCSIDFLNFSH